MGRRRSECCGTNVRRKVRSEKYEKYVEQWNEKYFLVCLIKWRSFLRSQLFATSFIAKKYLSSYCRPQAHWVSMPLLWERESEWHCIHFQQFQFFLLSSLFLKKLGRNLKIEGFSLFIQIEENRPLSIVKPSYINFLITWFLAIIVTAAVLLLRIINQLNWIYVGMT